MTGDGVALGVTLGIGLGVAAGVGTGVIGAAVAHDTSDTPSTPARRSFASFILDPLSSRAVQASSGLDWRRDGASRG